MVSDSEPEADNPAPKKESKKESNGPSEEDIEEEVDEYLQHNIFLEERKSPLPLNIVEL